MPTVREIPGVKYHFDNAKELARWLEEMAERDRVEADRVKVEGEDCERRVETQGGVVVNTAADVIAGRCKFAVEEADNLDWMRTLPDGCVSLDRRAARLTRRRVPTEWVSRCRVRAGWTG